jgi:hypothetical protein
MAKKPTTYRKVISRHAFPSEQDRGGTILMAVSKDLGEELPCCMICPALLGEDKRACLSLEVGADLKEWMAGQKSRLRAIQRGDEVYIEFANESLYTQFMLMKPLQIPYSWTMTFTISFDDVVAAKEQTSKE